MNDINLLSLKKLLMKNFLLKIYFFKPQERMALEEICIQLVL